MNGARTFLSANETGWKTRSPFASLVLVLDPYKKLPHRFFAGAPRGGLTYNCAVFVLVLLLVLVFDKVCDKVRDKVFGVHKVTPSFFRGTPRGGLAYY